MTAPASIRSRQAIAMLAGHLPTPDGIEGDAINALRFLAVDAVEEANSGHPGTAMALAPLAYRLFTHHLRHDPASPEWPDRDRFVLSIGHASMLLYGALHLSGYDLSMDDLRSFRQWGSRTPGHPERGVTPGVEVGTGPLGQGVANAVGMALAERMLAARYNSHGHDVVDHRTWAFAGDGDMMEGVAAEAASLAGHLRLGKLAVFYDDNHISLEGPTKLAFSEDVGNRFAAYNWHVTRLYDVGEIEAIDEAIADALDEPDRPSLVIVHSHIGVGSPVVDTAAAHGSPLGPEGAEAAREALGWAFPPFVVPEEVYAHWRAAVGVRASLHDDWRRRVERYTREQRGLADEFDRVLSGRLPDGWRDALPSFEPGKRMATRSSSGVVLNAIAPVVPELVGGAADVGPSTETVIDRTGDVAPRAFTGRNIRFGVREHAMASILNGMAAHDGLRVFGATYLAFSDYLRPAIRLSALMRLPVIYVFTHDSVVLGEDGPTHQPVEQIASLRVIPGLRVVRPADANETAQAWAMALEHDGPTALILSRQSLPVLDPSIGDIRRGARVLRDGRDAVIIATGSEVELALEAADLLATTGVDARVVSLSCWEAFREQGAATQARAIPPGLPSVSIEAGSTLGWLEFVDDAIGIDRFGASAAGELVRRELGLTVEAIADRVRRLMESRR